MENTLGNLLNRLRAKTEIYVCLLTGQIAGARDRTHAVVKQFIKKCRCVNWGGGTTFNLCRTQLHDELKQIAKDYWDSGIRRIDLHCVGDWPKVLINN